jgi:hypothetical protein
MVANRRIMGATEGTIIATIMTAHMTNVRTTSRTPQACIWGMAIAIAPSMVGMPHARYPM